MNQDIMQSFIHVLGSKRALEKEPMSRHTTFRIGGPADYFLTPENESELQQILQICRENDIPWFIMGNGSNLLAGDLGYRGAVICMFRGLTELDIQGNRIRAGAGVLLSRVSSAARDAALTGLEFAGGIPGTLGGAVMMNAGAYGGEMKQVLTTVRTMTQEGEIQLNRAEELELGYRSSRFARTGEIVLEAEMALSPGDPVQIEEKMKELTEKRIEKQPIDFPSAGSTFKRPEGHFAGKLIMDCGLRGFQIGGARVSDKHCGFVINVGGATAADVRSLIDRVHDIVLEKTGVELEPEIRFLGDFS